jgi:hypothetical protein
VGPVHCNQHSLWLSRKADEDEMDDVEGYDIFSE